MLGGMWKALLPVLAAMLAVYFLAAYFLERPRRQNVGYLYGAVQFTGMVCLFVSLLIDDEAWGFVFLGLALVALVVGNPWSRGHLLEAANLLRHRPPAAQ
jgi:hypothetical protein